MDDQSNNPYTNPSINNVPGSNPPPPAAAPEPTIPAFPPVPPANSGMGGGVSSMSQPDPVSAPAPMPSTTPVTEPTMPPVAAPSMPDPAPTIPSPYNVPEPAAPVAPVIPEPVAFTPSTPSTPPSPSVVEPVVMPASPMSEVSTAAVSAPAPVAPPVPEPVFTQPAPAAPAVAPAAASASGVVYNEQTGDSEGKGAGRYKVRVIANKCIGAASCVAVAPKAFKLNDQQIAVVLDTVNQESDENLLLSAQSCPTLAIEVIDTETGEKVWPK